MSTINPVRPSPIAGSWYSADPTTLSQEIEGYLNSAAIPEIEGNVVGLISPHAGYFYSGSTAGYAYRAIKGLQFDLCVVVSPLHNFLPHSLFSSAHEFFATPLGKIKVAKELLLEFSNKLIENGLPVPHLVSNDREHSLEIQLPFLQTALAAPFQLLPLMVRSIESELLRRTASILANVIEGKNVLLIASTDLSHFFDEETANSLDEVMLKCMTDFSPEAVLHAEADEKGFACGSGAVALVLWAAHYLGADKVSLLHHSTSAQASGDTSSVVGYGSLVITKQELT